MAAGERERITLERLVARARSRIERLSVFEAFEAAAEGALIVDIRSDGERERMGVVPGSLHIPRPVLEWRLAPDSLWRNPHVEGLDRPLVVICDEGFCSSLAAAVLVDLGYARVYDVVGGFAAWFLSGLPIATATGRRAPQELPGMGGPEPSPA
jgi:rhodanese-related sulfurtransferase